LPRVTPRRLADLAQAALWLAGARLRLARIPAGQLFRQGQQRPGGTDPQMAARIAWAVPRAAARLPWRADCFVQALAAQSWLARHGLGSDLTVGVRIDAPGGFAAHAWLRHGDLAVTGGDFSAYCPFPAIPTGRLG
jgi:hypothetical protein